MPLVLVGDPMIRCCFFKCYKLCALEKDGTCSPQTLQNFGLWLFRSQVLNYGVAGAVILPGPQIMHRPKLAIEVLGSVPRAVGSNVLPLSLRRFLFVYMGAQLLQRFDFLILLFSAILAVLARHLNPADS